MARLIDQTPDGWNGVLGAVLSNDDTLTGRYGSIVADEDDNFIRIDEHPEHLPVPFIKNVSKYLLTYDMLQAVKRYITTEKKGEYYVFTPFEELLENGSEHMKLIRSKGQYLDGGTLEGWLHANAVVCKDLVK